MAKGGKCNFEEIKKLQKQIEAMEADHDEFCQRCARELAARLLAKVIKRTPVGDHDSKTVEFTAHLPARQVEFDTKAGKHVSFMAKARAKKVKFTPKKSGAVGGTLRRGWTTQAKGSGSEGMKTGGASQYADTLKVHHFGDTYVVEIINPVKYASYVEYGHRTANHKGWVPGQFMMTISEKEIQAIAPKLLEKRLQEFIRGCMDDAK